jgi:uncharacterized protein YraI
MKPLIWTIAAAIGLASPAFAYAYATEAYVTMDIDLLAGPDQEYPKRAAMSLSRVARRVGNGAMWSLTANAAGYRATPLRSSTRTSMC